METEHYFYFATRKAAFEAISELRSTPETKLRGLRGLGDVRRSVRRSSPNPWLLILVTTGRDPERWRTLCEALAARHAGEYDGWSVAPKLGKRVSAAAERKPVRRKCH